jgi:putative component of membrane protein insertase Oxa1/YidC/SpoIIIJ protein YidD
MKGSAAAGTSSGARAGRNDGLIALALLAIRLYQRHLSPLKGYRCAYRAHTGCASCSHLGYRAIRRFGLWAGLPVLKQRLHRCAVAHARFGAPRALRQQAGVCDLACDAPLGALDCDCNCLGMAWDIGAWARGSDRRSGGACDGCCSGPQRNRSAAADALVHIPPDTRSRHRPLR